MGSVGLCECGCGKRTRIAAKTDRSKGWYKGQHLRFIHGHSGAANPVSPEERFWRSVDKRENGCWLWTKRQGRGRLGINYEEVLVYRFAYELLVGPIPEGFIVHHVCKNESCVKPEHLKAMSPRDHQHLHHIGLRKKRKVVV